MIIFENIHNGDTYGISRETEGKFYRAKLSALMNSSNMNPNADRAQDFGIRLAPEQQALIEQWEADPQMIDRVATWSKVMVDDLTHAEFLSYLLYQQELGNSPEKGDQAVKRDNQRDYEARVEALRAGKVEHMPAFESKVPRGEATLDDFMSGDLTGDAGGDKVEETLVDDDSLDGLDKALAETGNSLPPLKQGVDSAKQGEDKTTSTKKQPAKK